MRTRARVDGNHAAIVRALRGIGAHVQSMAALGKGCPDLLVSFRGKWYVMEVKDGAKPVSKQLLTQDELRWHAAARAEVCVVRSPDNALGILTTGEIQ